MTRPKPDAEAVPTAVPEASAVSGNDETPAFSQCVTGEPVEMPRFAPASHPGELGRLGKYRVQTELGRGGMGAVYLAFDERLQRKIALKVMLPKAAANVTAKDRFLREARAAAQISSDYVVNIHEADEIDGIPYIALQYLQGYPLDQFLTKHGNPSIPHILRIGMETALGLDAAHQLGLVHRDIKPGNLWLEAPNGRVKILDFGLARQQADDAHLTHSGAVVGTPAYMSPEQGRGLAVDHRSDLFSLGGVLYRLCTGRLAFKGDSTMALLMSIGMDEPIPVRELNPNVPEPLANLIHRLLAKDPANRPPSAKVVADELNAIFVLSQTSTALSNSQPQVIYVPMAIAEEQSGPNPFADIVEADSIDSASSTEREPPPEPKRPFPKMLVGSVLFALLVGVGAVLLITNNKKPESDIADKRPEGTPPKVIGGKGPTSQPTRDADRIAAEWVLSIGGRVRVNDGTSDIKASSELPRETFQLTSVNLGGIRQADDAGVSVFKGCKNLTSLRLEGTAVTDAGLANFKDCTNLTNLSFWHSQVGEAGLANFKDCKNMRGMHLRDMPNLTDAALPHFKGFKDLANLTLSGTQVSDAGLVHLKDLNELQNLSLTLTAVSDAGLKGLLDKTKLVVLDLQQTKVTAAGVEELKKALPECKIVWDGGTIEPRKSPDRAAAEYVLSIGGMVKVNEGVHEIFAPGGLPAEPFRLVMVSLNENQQVTDAGLASFKGCRNLHTIGLHDTPISDKGIANFKDCRDLMYLYLQGTQVSDAGLAHLKDCKSLLEVNLGGTRVEGPGLAYLKECKELSFLYLNSTPVTDAGLEGIRGFVSLQQLDLRKTKVMQGGIDALKAALPECKIEWDGGVIEPRVLPDRIAAKYVLSIGGVVSINDDRPVQGVTDLPREPFRLASVKLDGCKIVNDADLIAFKGCQNLVYLNLSRTQVTDKGLAYFKDCHKLTYLNLSLMRISDDGLRNFKDCKTLKILDLGDTAITDAGIGHFKDCPDLERVYLSHTAIGDAGVASLAKSKGLKELRMDGTQVSDTGLKELLDKSKLIDLNVTKTKVTTGGIMMLRKALPQCKIEWDGGVVEPKKSPDRLAAEYVLSIGGSVRINEEQRDIKDTVELPGKALLLTQVNLNGNTQITDAGLANFKDCKNLVYIDLGGTNVSDAGLANLKEYNALTGLGLADTKVGDAGLAHFAGCKTLTHIWLSNTQVTDAWVANFADCKTFTHIYLNNTKVGGACLTHFKTCKNLAYLDVRKTKVTPAEVAEFVKVLPGCKIDWDGGKIEPKK